MRVVIFPLTILLLVPFVAPEAITGFSWKCMGCRAAAEILKFVYERNATADEIIKIADYVCTHFADQDSLICKGITSEFRASFLYVFEQLVFRPHQLCGLLLQGCGSPHNPFDSNWTLPLPPKPKSHVSPTPLPPNPGRPLRILQLSDLHFDYGYKVGSEANCELAVCCNSWTLEEKSEKKPVKLPAGYWGSLAKCDVPYRTVELLFQHLNKSETVDFAFLSGDYMSHKDWLYTKSDHLNTIKNLSTLIATYLPNTPFYWTLGNHEGVPVNSFAPHFVPEVFRPQWIYDAVLQAGRKYLPPSVDESAVYRGSYSTLLKQNLKLVSLNTGYCETTNFFLYINQTDPDGTLSWLIEELYESEKKAQFVYILAHIPPGNSECLEGWARNYYRIVNRIQTRISISTVIGFDSDRIRQYLISTVNDFDSSAFSSM